MKDEEKKATEYADSIEEKKHWSDENDSNAVFTRQDIELAFLAGLKAGSPQWHDLRKNKTDLPEGMGLGSKEVYVAYKDGVTDFACYRFNKKYWERSENEELAENVIAWCEIPTFDKE